MEKLHLAFAVPPFVTLSLFLFAAAADDLYVLASGDTVFFPDGTSLYYRGWGGPISAAGVAVAVEALMAVPVALAAFSTLWAAGEVPAALAARKKKREEEEEALSLVAVNV